MSFGNTELQKVMDSRFGTKPVVMHYLNRAKNAASRVNTDIQGGNTLKLAADASEMATIINELHTFLAGDERKIGEAAVQKEN